MNKIEITQRPFTPEGQPSTTVLFERVTRIPVHAQFSSQPIDHIEISSISLTETSAEDLAAMQAVADHFALEQYRPDDRSAPRLRRLFDGHAYGRDEVYEIGAETHVRSRQTAAAMLVNDVRDFPCK